MRNSNLLFSFTASVVVFLIAAFAAATPPRVLPRSSYSGGNPAPLSEAAAAPQILDAQFFGPNAQQKLNLPGTAVVSAPDCDATTADGVSELVIRLQPLYFNAPIEFTIFDPNAANGGDAEHDGSIRISQPNLPAPLSASNFGQLQIAIPAGQPAVVYYRPPSRFILWQQDQGNVVPEIDVSVSAGPKQIAFSSFELAPPDEALIHGFLSAPASMTTLAVALAKALPAQSFYVDWSKQDDSGFGATAPLLADQVTAQIYRTRNPSLGDRAETQVDAIGHSMGGLLATWYAMNLGRTPLLNRPAPFIDGQWDGNLYRYLRPNNFGLGDFRRVITMDSPFTGTPVADTLDNYVERSDSRTVLMGALLGLGAIGGDGNALYDLSTASQATAIFANTHANVLWLPIAGQAAPNDASGLLPAWVQYLSAIDPNIPSASAAALNLFLGSVGLAPASSDMIVTVSSQEDSQGGNTPKYFLVQDVVHTQAESDPGEINYVLRALGDQSVSVTGVGPTTPGYSLFNSQY